MPQPVNKLDQLTTTRFIAALSVVLFHGGGNIGILKYLPMLSSGPTAVSYFYVLSGFVMALVYYRPGKSFEIKKYWLARFSRIYPVYIFSFVLTCIYYFEIISKIKADKIWANVFLYQAWFAEYAQSFNIAAWSLSVEIFFYIIFPLVLLLTYRLTTRKIIWGAIVFWAVSQLVHSAFFIQRMPEMQATLSYSPIFHLNAFLLGVAGGVWYLGSKTKQINSSANSILLIGATTMVLILLSLRDLTHVLPNTFSMDNGLLAPLFLVIILTLAADTTKLTKWMSHPWLVTLGDASYALYILHIPIRWLIERILAATHLSVPYEAMYITYMIFVILLSILVFKYIERPARDWLRDNPHKLKYIIMDLISIYLMIRLAFLLRLGDGVSHFLHTQNFMLRVGITVYFLCLLGWGLYKAFSPKKLAFGILTGTILLTGFMYHAWLQAWVEGFPRPIIILAAVFIFGAMFLTRQTFPSPLQPKA